MNRILVLAFLGLLLPRQSVGQKTGVFVGDTKMVYASGSWVESHEGVSLFCSRITTPEAIAKGNSSSICFLTEVQAISKDVATVATNFLAVQKWDAHGLTATASFIVNKNGDEVPASAPGAITFTVRAVADFDKRTLAKYVESPSATTGYHLGTK